MIITNHNILKHIKFMTFNPAGKAGLIKEGCNYAYNLNSKILFGKHKGNLLKDIYKCNPDYVHWCLINASGFVLSSTALEAIQREKVFNSEQLQRYFEYRNEHELSIDLRSFEENKNGFPYSQEVDEEDYFFSEESIDKNAEKLTKKIPEKEIAQGGNWKDTINSNHSSDRIKITILRK